MRMVFSSPVTDGQTKWLSTLDRYRRLKKEIPRL